MGIHYEIKEYLRFIDMTFVSVDLRVVFFVSKESACDTGDSASQVRDPSFVGVDRMEQWGRFIILRKNHESF